MAWMRFRKKEMPEGVWTKCDVCKEMLFAKELEEAFKVCKKCGHHNGNDHDTKNHGDPPWR